MLHIFPLLKWHWLRRWPDGSLFFSYKVVIYPGMSIPRGSQFRIITTGPGIWFWNPWLHLESESEIIDIGITWNQVEQREFTRTEIIFDSYGHVCLQTRDPLIWALLLHKKVKFPSLCSPHLTPCDMKRSCRPRKEESESVRTQQQQHIDHPHFLFKFFHIYSNSGNITCWKCGPAQFCSCSVTRDPGHQQQINTTARRGETEEERARGQRLYLTGRWRFYCATQTERLLGQQDPFLRRRRKRGAHAYHKRDEGERNIRVISDRYKKEREKRRKKVVGLWFILVGFFHSYLLRAHLWAAERKRMGRMAKMFLTQKEEEEERQELWTFEKGNNNLDVFLLIAGNKKRRT